MRKTALLVFALLILQIFLGILTILSGAQIILASIHQIGSIFLIVCLGRALVGHFKPDHHFGFEAAAWYWHFVDVVWLFLFFAIYWWGGLGGTVHGG